MVEIMCLTTYHLKIGNAAPNQLANSTDSTIYGLTDFPPPARLLLVDALLLHCRWLPYPTVRN